MLYAAIVAAITAATVVIVDEGDDSYFLLFPSQTWLFKDIYQ